MKKTNFTADNEKTLERIQLKSDQELKLIFNTILNLVLKLLPKFTLSQLEPQSCQGCHDSLGLVHYAKQKYSKSSISESVVQNSETLATVKEVENYFLNHSKSVKLFESSQRWILIKNELRERIISELNDDI